jgi:regulator of PEP synthase PpsR (kinase-PPPase family)
MNEPAQPSAYILSDSLGETADQVAKASLSQFDPGTFHVVRLPKVTSPSQLESIIEAIPGRPVVFYTFADPALRAEMSRLVDLFDLSVVDIMGPGVEQLAEVAGREPAWKSGMIRRTDRGYFRKIEALEFAVKHDDGRHPDDLHEAEIVLLGVSRTSKTPLSMYLAFQGYKVANVPLTLETEAPEELLTIDPRKIFGLVSDPDLLSEIRTARAIELGGYARRYAQTEYIEAEMETARQLMKKLGVITIRTAGRAIEESAQEIIRYIEASGVHA